jgi:AraC-like DNA-binding protein
VESFFESIRGKAYGKYATELYMRESALRSKEEYLDFINQLDKAIRHGGRVLELEREFMQLRYRQEVLGEDAAAMAHLFIRLADQGEHEQLYPFSLHSLYLAFEEYRIHLRDYAALFKVCYRMERLLKRVNVPDFPYSLHIRAMMAEAYFHFDNYDRSFELLTEILDHTRLADQVGSLPSAYNTMGLIYAERGELEKARRMFSLILSRDLITQISPGNSFRWNAIARGNMGDMYCRMGKHDYGIPLLKMSMDSMAMAGDYRYACGRAIDLVRAYTYKKDKAQAKQYVDLAQQYNTISDVKRNVELFYALSQFYLLMDNPEKAYALLDSAVTYEHRENEELRDLRVAFTNIGKSEEASSIKNGTTRATSSYIAWMLLLTGGLMLSFGTIALFVVKRQKYKWQREAVTKVMAVERQKKAHREADMEQNLYQRMTRMLESTKIYTHPDINLTMMAQQLGAGRTQLSNAVNHVGQCNFNELVNHYRILAAIDLLQNHGKQLTIETVAAEVGFRDRSVFYRAFKKETGKLPSEYVSLDDKTLEEIIES